MSSSAPRCGNFKVFPYVCYFLFASAIKASGVQELTLNHPNIVNQKKNMELRYGPGTFLSSHK